jgi:hypothetical protein
MSMFIAKIERPDAHVFTNASKPSGEMRNIIDRRHMGGRSGKGGHEIGDHVRKKDATHVIYFIQSGSKLPIAMADADMIKAVERFISSITDSTNDFQSMKKKDWIE